LAQQTQYFSDVTTCTLELRGNISTRLRQCIAYADDILITARTKQAMIDTFVKLKNESSKYGLTVNVHKTKYLKCSRRQDQSKHINIENKLNKLNHLNILGQL
jgi:hypothetical protein